MNEHMLEWSCLMHEWGNSKYVPFVKRKEGGGKKKNAHTTHHIKSVKKHH